MGIKNLIAKIITLPVLGWFLYKIFKGNIYDIRWQHRHFAPPDIDPKIYASIFWGFYENAERSLLDMHLNSDTLVVELGSSLGIVSKHVLSKLNKGALYYAVEMNPILIETIQKNTSLITRNKFIDFKILNNAISYQNDIVPIILSKNTTESKITSDSIPHTLTIKSIKLNQITSQIPPNHTHKTLICDIEGAEIQIIKEDKNAIKKFNDIFIEIHDTSYKNITYKKEEILEILTKEYKLTLIDRHGWTFYFTNKI